MKAVCVLAAVLVSPGLLVVALDSAPSDKKTNQQEAPHAKPVTTLTGKAGDLVRRWWKEGTAAGNIGDRYDNRDGDHSPLDVRLFPQLAKIAYSPEDVKLRRHWAAQRVLLTGVVFGNSSTSAPPTLGGSNPRMYYSVTDGLHFLTRQYRANNLYIYPEHRDHDPGHNGKNDGFGDLYPTNTPYLLISQGSSGSDQPFMRAVPLALAALRPEVKKKLADSGFLMPTLQMLLRSTNRHLKSADEYLTGKAHPTVFEGRWIDDVALVERAHALKLDALPPLVQLTVSKEDEPTAGVDFFERAGVTEKLADTPGAIARIFRGTQRERRLVVSAAGSLDLNKAPLTFTWVVLRGDADRIVIRPRNKQRSLAEIVVSYQPRCPITPGSPLASNRVEIGVFAHNGTYWSAPAFVTFFSLDDEARTYDADGTISEVGYGLGETTYTVPDWEKLLVQLSRPATLRQLGLASNLSRAFGELAVTYRKLANTERQAHEAEKASAAEENGVTKMRNVAAAVVKSLQAALAKEPKSASRKEVARAALALAEADSKLMKARQQAAAARQALAAARLQTRNFLNQKREAFDTSLADLLAHSCRARAAEPRSLEALAKPAQRKQLQAWGLMDETGAVRPRGGAGWTAFEKALLEQHVARAIAETVLPGLLHVGYQVNYVDPRIATPRQWRDVYRHDAKGRLLGWTRYGPNGPTEYNFEGQLVEAKDGRGRCLRSRAVSYERDAAKGRWINTNPLRIVPGDGRRTYTYDGPDDLRGHRIETRSD